MGVGGDDKEGGGGIRNTSGSRGLSGVLPARY